MSSLREWERALNIYLPTLPAVPLAENVPQNLFRIVSRSRSDIVNERVGTLPRPGDMVG